MVLWLQVEEFNNLGRGILVFVLGSEKNDGDGALLFLEVSV